MNQDLDSICDEFEAAWASNAGQRPDINSFLGCVADTKRAQLLGALIHIELWWRRAETPAPTVSEFQTRFPGYDTLVRIAFEQCRLRLTTTPTEQQIAECVVQRPDVGTGSDDSQEGGIGTAELEETLSYIVAANDGIVSTFLGPMLNSDVQPTHIDNEVVLSSRYRLTSQLGQGGMGTVMLGEDVRLGRKVAVKLIRDRHWNSDHRELMKSEFEREARVGAGLVHPAIAAVHDYGFHQSTPYIVFEHVAGESLAGRIRRQSRFDIDDVREIVGRLALALDYAHEKGIVHRDLKPDNVRFDEYGQPKILDFGLAKEFRHHTNWSFAGTPAYASPEQASEEPSDGRSDQYALALIAYEMLIGQRPFAASSWKEMLAAQREQAVEWPKKANLDFPASTRVAIEKALNKRPNQRFHSCTEFAMAFGCRIQLRRAAGVSFELEGPAKLPGEGILPNYAWVGLREKELWISANDRIVVIDVCGLKSATAEIKSIRPAGILGKEILSNGIFGMKLFGSTGPTSPRFLKGIFLKESRKGPFWNRTKAKLPEGISPITMPTQEIAQTWSQRLESIIQESSDRFPHDTPLIREISPPMLITAAPSSRLQILGPCAVTADSRRHAILKLKVQAAFNEADGVVEFQLEKLVTADGTRWNARGIATKSLDSTTREEFELREYGRRCRLFGLMAVAFVVVALAVRLSLIEVLPSQLSQLTVFGASIRTALMLYSMPLLILAVLIVITKWPQILRPLAFCIGAWSLVFVLMLLGILYLKWSGDSSIDQFLSPGRQIRKALFKTDGLIWATGGALAAKLVAAARIPAVKGRRRRTLVRSSAGYLAWGLAVSSVVLPLMAIGWGLNYEVSEN